MFRPRMLEPRLVVIAAGFDSARGDPIGGFDLTPDGYVAMLHDLQTLASANPRTRACNVAPQPPPFSAVR